MKALALLLVAVSASASIAMTRSWALSDDSGERIRVTEVASGVDLTAYRTSRFEAVHMTKDEAASLGRALLEAAGQPEKVCPPASCGVITTTPGCSVFQGYGTIPAGASPLNTEVK